MSCARWAAWPRPSTPERGVPPCVRRTVYPDVPVRVEYALTDACRTLLEPLRALQKWSIEHLSDVSVSQDAYDRAE
ncbi:winged helix-turn-helix transcriptional regulator [Nonomuraea sp. CA-141351]|uniref:winged helix-turn-helix transcriptional regulator n=1 Tax=Nonomuraea sp. CA-141351 TaxID=3239996 RepID=UPI003D931F4C